MSLRDQLVKAGLASKKAKRQAERDLKLVRKRGQAKRVSKKEARRQRREEAERVEKRALEAKLAQRLERRDAEEAAARRLRANQLAEHHGLRYQRGPQPFWHHEPSGVILHRLDLPLSLARDLRAGRLAVAWSEQLGEQAFHVVSRQVALRLRGILPERVLFLNEQPPDPEDPAERLAKPRDLG